MDILTSGYFDATNIMTLEKIEILEELGQKLRTIPKKHFDMSTWSHAKRTKNFSTESKKRAFECGYVGCAIGYLPILVPRVRKMGFDIYKTINYFGKKVLHPMYCTNGCTDPYDPAFSENPESDDAIMEFLGITYNELDLLFMPESYEYINDKDISPKQVSERILDFCKEKRKLLKKKVTKKARPKAKKPKKNK